MLGDRILLLDSWMEQKGVDGFSLSASSFHIQQIRAAGCCGDDTEKAPAHLHRHRAPPVWTQASLGAALCCGKHDNNNKREAGRREDGGGDGRREGSDAPLVSAVTNKTG